METKTTTKIALIAAIALIIAVSGCFGYRSYVRWRQSSLISEARGLLEKSDYRGTFLCLRSALEHDINDVEACRLMAQLHEAVGSTNSILWRKRVVELNPKSTQDQLRLIQAAINGGDYLVASNALGALGALGGVEQFQTNSVTYQEAAASLDVALKRFTEAEGHLRELARLEPENKEPLVNIAILDLHGTNDETVAKGRDSLRQMVSDPAFTPFRCAVLRELTADAMILRQTNAAIGFCTQLVEQTNSIFDDRVVRLNLLLDSGSPDFKSALSAAQEAAAKKPADITQLATWQMSKQEAPNTLAWLQSLPKATRTNEAVQIAEAECQVETGAWEVLQKQIENQKWENSEFLRFAFQARALRQQDLAGASREKWGLAMKSALGQVPKLKMLLRLAVQWHWPNESEEALAGIVKWSPGDDVDFQTLAQILYMHGHTRGLMQLYVDKVAEDPANLLAKNNMAWTALLLNAKEVKPDYAAHEVYQQEPTNAVFASTYALSLLLQKRNTEALQVLEKFDARELEEPSTAAIYGLALRANGNPNKAAKYLKIGARASMLPEQRKMMESTNRDVAVPEDPSDLP